MDEDQGGNNRRDLLKKAAVGGAIAFGLPAIISSPAFAAARKCSISAGCTKYYYAKYNTSTGEIENSNNVGGQCPDKELVDLQCPSQTGSPTFGYGGALPGFSVTPVIGAAPNGDTRSYTFNLPAGSIPIFLNSHFGNPIGCLLWSFPDNGILTTPLTNLPCLTVSTSGTIAGGIKVTIASTCNVGWSGLMIYFCI